MHAGSANFTQYGLAASTGSQLACLQLLLTSVPCCTPSPTYLCMQHSDFHHLYEHHYSAGGWSGQPHAASIIMIHGMKRHHRLACLVIASCSVPVWQPVSLVCGLRACCHQCIIACRVRHHQLTWTHVQLQHKLAQGLGRTNAGSIQLLCVVCRVYASSDGPW